MVSPMPTRRMHQTTVRFGGDLWEALEAECAEAGVSIAQYVREAALARLVYAAGKRSNPELELALITALERDTVEVGAGLAIHRASDEQAEASESREARRHTREQREQVTRTRQRRAGLARAE
jgi:hypothetical protein